MAEKNPKKNPFLARLQNEEIFTENMAYEAPEYGIRTPTLMSYEPNLLGMWGAL